MKTAIALHPKLELELTLENADKDRRTEFQAVAHKALIKAGRWRMLTSHLQEMARARLPKGRRVEALQEMAVVLRNRVGAVDEAETIQRKARSLAESAPGWLWALRVAAVVLGAIAAYTAVMML